MYIIIELSYFPQTFFMSLIQILNGRGMGVSIGGPSPPSPDIDMEETPSPSIFDCPTLVDEVQFLSQLNRFQFIHDFMKQ